MQLGCRLCHVDAPEAHKGTRRLSASRAGASPPSPTASLTCHQLQAPPSSPATVQFRPIECARRQRHRRPHFHPLCQFISLLFLSVCFLPSSTLIHVTPSPFENLHASPHRYSDDLLSRKNGQGQRRPGCLQCHIQRCTYPTIFHDAPPSWTFNCSLYVYPLMPTFQHRCTKFMLWLVAMSSSRSSAS